MQSIDIFPWDEHFNTGLESVDRQHKKLVAILNRLATHMTYDTSKEALNSIFDELIEYTLYHFETEEAIWDGYLPHDALDEKHKKVHASFVETALRLKREQMLRPLSEIVDEALGFLARWLAAHILETDREMAYIVFAIQEGKSLEEAKIQAQQKMSGSGRLLIDIILSIYSTLSANTLHLMRELKFHTSFEEKMRYQEEYRKLLFELSALFINSPLQELEGIIENALENMARFVGADRAYIFEYNEIMQTSSNTYEWCQENICPQKEELQNLPLRVIPGWFEIHSRGENVSIEDVNALSDGSLRDLLAAQEIQSLITIPLMHKGVCQGFVGFDAVEYRRSFTQDEVELLQLFSILLSNVNERKSQEEELTYERSFLKTLIQTIPDLVWFKNPQGAYMACNKRFEEFFGVKEQEIIGKTDYDFVEKGLADIFRFNDEKAMQSEKASVNIEEIPFASDGHKEIVQTTKVPMYDDNEKLMGVLGVARDITQSTLMANALKSERIMLQAILDNAPLGIWMTTPKGRVKFVNKTFSDATGISEAEFLNAQHYADLLPSDATPNCMHSDAQALLLDSGAYSTTQTLPFVDGHNHLLEITKVKITDAQGESGIIGLAMDITERQKQQNHLEYIAHYDALTGLPNRVLLADRLHQALVQAYRHKSSLAVVYLDLDGFKSINDMYGHDAGDKLLSALAKNMKETLREGDTIARLGGDEFVAVLPDLKEHTQSIAIIERLLLASSQELLIDGIEMQVSASLGVAFLDENEVIDADQLLRQADQAMYQAKLSGKNRYHVFDLLMDKKTRIHHKSLDEVQSALDENEFLLYYQPKVNMRSGEILGVEALVRWRHPKNGLLNPAHFLPIIQGHELSVKLGKWVLATAIRQLEEWKQAGITLCMSVNVDAMQLQEKEFIEDLQTLLGAHPLVGRGDLSLEVLETNALDDMIHVTEMMHGCKKIGVAFSLDDFGTGYSSLTYLKRLPANELKIDQSFVRDMLEDPEDLAILDGILGLANAFGRDIIAEGVESIEHGEMLLRMGCEIGQGYIIARPMPAYEIVQWMKKWKPDKRWQNISLVHREDMPLIYALAEQGSLMKGIGAYFLKKRFSSPSLNYLGSHFIAWLHKNGHKDYEKYPILEQLELLHFQMYEDAGTLVYKYETGLLENREEALKELQAKSTHLQKMLMELIHECAVAKNER